MNTSRNKSTYNSQNNQLHDAIVAKLEEIENIILILKDKLKEYRKDKIKELKLLQSVSLGLYDEIDKLSKKAPAEPVTDLVLEQMNDVIRETKLLLVDDIYIQRIKEFIPAGDNPQHRDAVVVLRQIRQGLDRLNTQLDDIGNNIKLKISEAGLIQYALECAMEGDDLNEYTVMKFHNNDNWMIGRSQKEFNLDKLDKMDIKEYFLTEN
ncbi:hypothetical protein [Herpetosiphon llansteffanensis]|uniref:hypothetical protein n=1 Tax=Herpetosiphon llansteffanensis TaxID=2094568 RepID=UPI000D7CD68F|nr:hypothetical protein [Herpetosiphon llansteffanensis]